MSVLVLNAVACCLVLEAQCFAVLYGDDDDRNGDEGFIYNGVFGNNEGTITFFCNI